MPPPPNHYTPSVDHDSMDFGYPFVFDRYEDFINDLAQRAISHPIGIAQIDVRMYIEEHRAELDHIADVLIEMFDLPHEDLISSDTRVANSDAAQQKGDDAQGRMNRHAAGHTNGLVNGHASGHANVTDGYETRQNDRDELLMPNSSPSAPATYQSTARLQKNDGQHHVNTLGRNAHTALAQDSGNTSSGHGLSTTSETYSPLSIRRHTVP